MCRSQCHCTRWGGCSVLHAARLSLKVCMHLWRWVVLCEMWLCSALERVGGNATQNCNDAQWFKGMMLAWRKLHAKSDSTKKSTWVQHNSEAKQQPILSQQPCYLRAPSEELNNREPMLSCNSRHLPRLSNEPHYTISSIQQAKMIWLVSALNMKKKRMTNKRELQNHLLKRNKWLTVQYWNRRNWFQQSPPVIMSGANLTCGCVISTPSTR